MLLLLLLLMMMMMTTMTMTMTSAYECRSAQHYEQVVKSSEWSGISYQAHAATFFHPNSPSCSPLV
jgi:hypothetical protein